MQAHYASEGFDPQAFMESLGVRGDLSVYSRYPLRQMPACR
jgi:hypothetical protein